MPELLFLMFALPTLPPPAHEAVVVLDESRASRVLVSEWNRDWPLKWLRRDCEIRYKVRFSHRLEFRPLAKYPALLIGNQPPIALRATASGDALNSLHDAILTESAVQEELIVAKKFAFDPIARDGWRDGGWNDDGTPIDGTEKGPEPAVAPAPPEESETP